VHSASRNGSGGRVAGAATGLRGADQLRELIIASLHNSKLFVLTEDPEKADAFLRGAGEDLIYTDQFQSSDSLTMRATTGAGSRSASASPLANLANRSAGVTVGDNESVNIHERKHEAMASVRLVNKEGDVIWSTTQESGGAKFRGASVDVAEKITRQLVEDFAKARSAPR
jgi:predicted Zn-dependent protease